ncbi:hypothetical protein [Rhizobium sp. BE258]|jgi:hypothetical protein|uniref:hypothetical protein n=1 Tax=unclassified Rhizobium TaxID=2613769 RepID=UPI000DD92DC1|nr:hypothetical protein [Rhizobium sp. BE258]MDR7142443.1 hypothetical protein [Rhizobium sp. BE258]
MANKDQVLVTLRTYMQVKRAHDRNQAEYLAILQEKSREEPIDTAAIAELTAAHHELQRPLIEEMSYRWQVLEAWYDDIEVDLVSWAIRNPKFASTARG